MTGSGYQVRRATLDDVGQLAELWRLMQFPVEELSRRVTEFQVALDGAGKVLGAAGLQILHKQGCIHHEGFTDFSLGDTLRPLFWDRFRSVANNHGVTRLWTSEQAPFWRHCGLHEPDADAWKKFPGEWKNANAAWLTLKLKDDVETILSADHEFALFMATEKERSQRAIRRGKILKVVATVVAFGVLFLVIAGAILFARRGAHLFPR